MNISSFFIDRPIFASVISILILTAGLVAMPLLPISEYPEIVPPTVVIAGTYPGASPKTIAETVITPLEQQINGVENAIYTNSSATPDGNFAITVTFKLGTNLDTAQVQTQNRVSQAEPRLPEVVRQIGLVTQKRSPDLTMVVFLRSEDGRYDSLYLRNYAVIQIRDVLARLPGMGDVRVFGSGDYAMRLWLDPGKIAARNMDVDEVLTAVREQNVQVAAGQIGGQPSLPGIEFQYIVNAQGRLQTEQEFENIVIKNGANGETTYLRDVARLELGPDNYALRSMLDGGPAVAIPVFQLPGANALELSDHVRESMKELAKTFPEGVRYEIDYDPTVFVPVAFVSGLTGQFYRQFGITIAASTIISTFNSLTLSPALAALLLKPKNAPPDAFQRGINRVFGLLLAGTWGIFQIVPGGFIPPQDKQYLIGIVQLPDAASLDRTESVVRRMSQLAKETPGVDHVIGFSGLSVQGFVNLSNAAVLFFPLKPFDERTTKSLSAGAIAQELSKKFSTIQDAVIFAVPPPPVQGLGTTGGFKLYVQDRGAHGYDELARVTAEVLNKARQQHELNPYATYSTFQNSVPQLYADVDRVKAKNQGVPLSNVFDTLQAYLGSVYINDFNRFGRTYRVYAQAEAQFRSQPEDIANLK